MLSTTEKKNTAKKDREFAEKRELVRNLLDDCDEDQKVWRIFVRDYFDGYAAHQFLPELNPYVPEIHLLNNELIFVDKKERHHANLHALVTCIDDSVRMVHVHTELDPESEHVVIHRPHINVYRMDGDKPNTKIKLPKVTRDAFAYIKNMLRPLTTEELGKVFSNDDLKSTNTVL